MKGEHKEKTLKMYVFLILVLMLFVNYDINTNFYLYRKRFIPLLAEKNQVNYSVVLDAGHGGIDKGTSYEDLYEKDINLKIAFYAKKYLEDKGINVHMTREEDILLSLREIGDFVNNIAPNVFVSIHVNSFKDPSYDGVISFYYSEKEFQKEERIKLSSLIQQEISKSEIWFNREIKEQNIAVLRYSNYPCSLVEVGFITNEGDRQKLREEDILKVTGENIAKGILNYIGVES